MAKARDIDGLRADMPFAEAAAATVAVRAEELFEHSENVLDMSDIERVHDMRVASRRLRAVLEIYAPCFPTDQFKPLLKEVKALADALGARRDPDVLLDKLSELEAVLPKAATPGIEAFAAPARVEQERGNDVLAAALAEAERNDLRGRLAALAAAAVAPPAPEADDDDLPEPEAPPEAPRDAAPVPALDEDVPGDGDGDAQRPATGAAA
jgi:CHAD domain-containing protein